MYAIIETGGKQYRVELGTELEVERLAGDPGGEIVLDQVLLVADGDSATIGNIYARLEPTAAGTPLFFCAHLDTVPPEGAVDPVVEDGFVRNAAGTILGADNKSAVVAMLEGVRRLLAEARPHAGVEHLAKARFAVDGPIGD